MSWLAGTALAIVAVSALSAVVRRIRRGYAAARRDEMRVEQWTDRPPR